MKKTYRPHQSTRYTHQNAPREGKALPELYKNREHCCGCSACYAICPQNAIRMEADNEGFLYPTVNAAACIGCCQCMTVCAFQDKLEKRGDCQKNDARQETLLDSTRVYAGRVKDESILLKSSSGGAFTALSDVFLDRQCAVVCSLYNEQNQRQEFRLIETARERDLARGSMYFQSEPGDIFLESENWLKCHPGKEILFVGMGCQAAGFIQYAKQKGFIDRVVTVDIICHGSPSQLIWKEYSDDLEKRCGKIHRIAFKDKRSGWLNPTAVAATESGEVSLLAYVNLFYSGKILRPSCHCCPYASIQRDTDITIGDFWNIQKTRPDFYHENGTSVFLIHTKKGLALFEHAKSSLDWIESNTADCWQENLERPTQADFERDRFWMDYGEKGFAYTLSRHGTVSLTHKAVRKIRKLASKLIKL